MQKISHALLLDSKTFVSYIDILGLKKDDKFLIFAKNGLSTRTIIATRNKLEALSNHPMWESKVLDSAKSLTDSFSDARFLLPDHKLKVYRFKQDYWGRKILYKNVVADSFIKAAKFVLKTVKGNKSDRGVLSLDEVLNISDFNYNDDFLQKN